MTRQKRVAAIHDISGFGKCSLTVALPIISAAGVETSVIPTAVLSTHTGGIDGFTYRDLTNDMTPFAEHWKTLNLKFDALYSGFLGSFEQIDIVSGIFDMLKSEDTLIMVDPCMADNGELYKIYTKDMVGGMAKLCTKADIIVPNITEACFMLGREYKDGPYTIDYIEGIIRDLALKLSCKKIVLTGVYFEKDKLGAAAYNKETGKINYLFNNRVEGLYHGTGDVFASALLSAILNGFSLEESTKIAVDFTYNSIVLTHKSQTDRRFGVRFENSIPEFIKDLKLV